MADSKDEVRPGSRQGGAATSNKVAGTTMNEMEEERRVIALANELRISSTISPRELFSLRLTSPLESDDDIDEEDAKDEEGARRGEEETDGSGGAGFEPRCVGVVCGNSDSCAAVSKVEMAPRSDPLVKM